MNVQIDKIKLAEIGGRTFQIRKMNPKAAVKVTKILGAKILPFLDKVPWSLVEDFASGALAIDVNNLKELDVLLSGLDLGGLAGALDLIGDDDGLRAYALFRAASGGTDAGDERERGLRGCGRGG